MTSMQATNQTLEKKINGMLLEEKFVLDARVFDSNLATKKTSPQENLFASKLKKGVAVLSNPATVFKLDSICL